MGGLFGCALKSDCTMDLFYGTDYHSHLGTKRGGMAVKNSRGMAKAIKNIENSYFRTKFETELPHLEGNKGIGVISDNDSQPLIIGSHLGTFGIATVAKINNRAELAADAFKWGIHFSEAGEGEVNPTELVGMLINQGKDFVDGIKSAQAQVQGSCSMLLLTEKGVYAARDRLGRTPLVLGKKDGGYGVTFETTAFFNLGYEVVHYLGPGEIVLITPEGFETISPPGDHMQVCAFLWVYYGYPASSYEGISVEDVRYRCGRAMARDDDTPVDTVSGIPDSGIGHAIGYANEKKIPYMRPFVKYTPTWPRSFMPQNQQDRDLVARMKLIPVTALISGKRLLFCDDSIVRGTQLQDNVRILYDAGAKEVHMRIACPTLVYPCLFLNFSTSRSTLDLAGRKAIYDLEGREREESIHGYADPDAQKTEDMVEKIREKLGLTSLKYQRLEDMVEAIGLPKQKLCTHCWDGSSYY
ncbi:MAG: amidophosphoribosyltransferase [Desulfobacterales bacterium]|nr:amidophosphoribosyltransferase [Desulfobacterales bacterium]MBS3754350.1 amidophosphoribosyltransferase [Desulfobacterales bacterium]